MTAEQGRQVRRVARRVVGWLGTTLGSLGVVLCLVGFVGVWWVHARVQAPLALAAATVGELAEGVRDKAGEVHDGIGTAREAVGGIEERIRERVQEALELSAEDLVRLAGLEEEVRSGIVRVQNWIAVAETAAALIDQAVSMVESMVGATREVTEQERSLTEWVELGKAEIEQAVVLLDEFHLQLATVKPGAPDGPLRAPLQEGLARVDGRLVAMQEQTSAFSDAVGAVEERIMELHDRVRALLRGVTVVLSVLLVWQLAAQASLAVHGWGWGRGEGESSPGSHEGTEEMSA